MEEETKIFSRGEHDKDGWVPTGGVAPLFWRFLVGLISESASSGISRFLVWEKSTVGKTMALIYPSETWCIVSSFLMCPVRSSILTKFEGEFLSDSKYSELLSLTPQLSAYMISLSGLACGLGDALLLSIGCERFEFILPSPMAAGVGVSGVEVLVSTWAVWTVSFQASKVGHSANLFRNLGYNAGTYG